MFDKREGKKGVCWGKDGFIYLNEITSERWKNGGIKERKYKDYEILIENKGRTIDPIDWDETSSRWTSILCGERMKMK